MHMSHPEDAYANCQPGFSDSKAAADSKQRADMCCCKLLRKADTPASKTSIAAAEEATSEAAANKDRTHGQSVGALTGAR
jgi:hypothetical protein